MLFSYGVDQSYILEVEVNDKRYVNFVSVNMEKNALCSALQWLRGIFNVVQISYRCIFDNEKVDWQDIASNN